MTLFKTLLILILLLILLIAFVPKDTNRHPITGIITHTFKDEGNFKWWVATDNGIQTVSEIPEEVFKLYDKGDRITVMIRGEQYRYMEDIR